jgi:L-2-hydroxyglutarate oxidase LhgO
LPALEELEQRGKANGLKGITRLDNNAIREFEPHATGIAALHVPEAGVADYLAVAEVLATDLVAGGAMLAMGHEVTSIDHTDSAVVVSTGGTTFRARLLVNCAGLQSDRVARMAGVTPSVRIVPFRGEYYKLAKSGDHLVKALIYPVPDSRFPFLGVHFTRRVDGTVEVGPNAVLALGREHYRGTKPNWNDVRQTVSHGGFLKLAAKHIWSGGRELLNSRSTSLYARSARRLVPDLARGDLLHGGSGVRAQAVDSAGRLVDDFVIEEMGRSVHVLNAPSPGATACLAIGREIAGKLDGMI